MLAHRRMFLQRERGSVASRCDLLPSDFPRIFRNPSPAGAGPIGAGTGAFARTSPVQSSRKIARRKLALTTSRVSKTPTPHTKPHQRQTRCHQDQQPHERTTAGGPRLESVVISPHPPAWERYAPQKSTHNRRWPGQSNRTSRPLSSFHFP